ncbi:hypothetical protein ACIBJF_32505 [Streptomyces sp. NPDC050743]|uniref:hypothetical protein n=1 Tax=Streptomyces sp. NPDC050743 TaxID=3365634 RepID=UPI0037B95DA8
MLGTTYPTLDATAKAGAWPTWNQLRGKFIVFPITGTIENRLAGYDLDHLSTEQEYAQHLADLSAAGRLEQASMWPAMTRRSRTATPATSTMPPCVPGLPSSTPKPTHWLNDGYTMSWYCRGRYLTVEGAAESVVPTLDDTDPDPTAAAQCVRYLAQQRHSSATTFDWTNTPGAFTLWPRGC